MRGKPYDKDQETKRNSYPTLNEVYASGLYIYIYMSTHKARIIIDQIRGHSYEETLMIL